MSLGSNYQLCLGQKFGIEFAIHTLRDQYSKTSANTVLLIDAENAFNSLNRKLALKNIENTCPSLLTAIKNSYPTHLNCSLTKKNLPWLSGFKQVFKAFTRGRTQRDIILTSFPYPFQDVQVSSLAVPTDHLAENCSPFQKNRPENLQKLEFFCDQQDRKRQSFNFAIDNQDFDYSLDYTNVDNTMVELIRVLMVELNHYCPIKKVKMSTRDLFYNTPLIKFRTKQKNRAYSLKKYQKAADLEAKIKILIRNNLINKYRKDSKQ